jgi:two-component system phosphate regulon sensor histidine kinase PhoR
MGNERQAGQPDRQQLGFRRCEPHDTVCHLAQMQDWHDAFESTIEEEITRLRGLIAQSRTARHDCSRNYSGMLELSRAKTRFMYELSHELRAPLAAVAGILDVVTSGYVADDAAKQAELMGRARQRVREMNALLADLLVLARLEERTVCIRKQPLDIGALLAELAADAGHEAGKHGVGLSVAIAPGLPTCLGNPELLKRVFINVIDNAVEYNHPGGTVEVAARPVGPGIVVTVTDDGASVDEEELPRVFDLFFRGRYARNLGRREAMGLGLSLVRRIVEDHEGTIELARRAGPGTVATISLPLRPTGGTNGQACTDS